MPVVGWPHSAKHHTSLQVWKQSAGPDYDALRCEGPLGEAWTGADEPAVFTFQGEPWLLLAKVCWRPVRVGRAPLFFGRTSWNLLSPWVREEVFKQYL